MLPMSWASPSPSTCPGMPRHSRRCLPGYRCLALQAADRGEMVHSTIFPGDSPMMKRHVWRLARRPAGAISDQDLVYGEETLPDLPDGHVLLRVRYLSIDPAQRVFMGEQEQFAPPVEIGAPVVGIVAGVVVASRKADVAVGTVLAGMGEWADHIVTDGTGFAPLPEVPGRDLADGRGWLSLGGPTAYVGVLEVGRGKAGGWRGGSAAAGGGGQVVGQWGRMQGCWVSGIAGGGEKAAFEPETLGFDACIE